MFRKALTDAHPSVYRYTTKAVFDAAFEKARAGEGRVVLISGEAGIGKSRLAVGLRDEPRATPRLWVGMAGSPYTSGSALRPVIDVFEERLALANGIPREEQSKLVAELYERCARDWGASAIRDAR